MGTEKNRSKKYSAWVFALFALALAALAACNKDMVNKHQFVQTGDTTLSARTPKILYIVLDGARGSSIETTLAPNLRLIKRSANYTYQSVADESGLDATTWADMLTGVTKLKHKVTNANFTGNNLAQYPMFFKYIKDNTNLRTAAFCASQRLSQNLISNADAAQTFNDDDNAVKTAAVTELKREDAAVVLAEFNAINRAGAQFGYDNTVPQYQQAILTADTYIGEMMDALKARPTYSSENWLVIIASNQGGIYPVNPADNDGTLFSEPLLNNFVLFYNPSFANMVYEKPKTTDLAYEGRQMLLEGTTNRATMSATNASIFNFGNNINNEYTVEFKLKVNTFGTGSADILCKNNNPYAGNDGYSGWWIIQNGPGRWRFGGNGSPLTIVSNTLVPALQTQVWYTLGFKIYKENGKRWVKLYQDGVPASDAVDVSSKNFTNAAPLTAGYLGATGTTAKQYISDIRLFKTALPDNIIQQYACAIRVPATHPYYSSLIGAWSCIDGQGTQFVDKISRTRNFNLPSTVTWQDFQDYDDKLCVVFDPDKYNDMPLGKDIPKYILTWLGIRLSSGQLDGKSWAPVYKGTL